MPDSPKSFSQTYRQSVERQLQSGAPHSTLGGNLKFNQRFEVAGVDVIAKLDTFGLNNASSCVDYGCGTLRVGQHIIRRLDVGSFVGLDISDYLLAEGRALIGEALVADKQPRLELISEQTVANIAATKPEFVFANAVLMHIHPDEVARFARHLAMLAGDWGQAVFSVRLARRSIAYRQRSRTHTLAFLQTVFAELDVGLHELASEPSSKPGAEDARRCWLKLIPQSVNR